MGKPSSPVSIELQLVQHVLVLVHVLELVHVKVLQFNLALRRGVLGPCDHEKLDGVVLSMLHCPSPINVRNFRPNQWLSTVMSKAVFLTMRKEEIGAELLTDSLVSCSVFCLVMCTADLLVVYLSQNTLCLV